jgi:hypothetical protein
VSLSFATLSPIGLTFLAFDPINARQIDPHKKPATPKRIMSTIYVEIGPGRRIDSHLKERARAIANSVSDTPRLAAKINETSCCPNYVPANRRPV